MSDTKQHKLEMWCQKCPAALLCMTKQVAIRCCRGNCGRGYLCVENPDDLRQDIHQMRLARDQLRKCRQRRRTEFEWVCDMCAHKINRKVDDDVQDKLLEKYKSKLKKINLPGYAGEEEW